MKRIHVKYFALLREQRGASEDRLETDAAKASDLYESLQATYGFTLKHDQLKVAINEEFRPWDSAIADGDTVVFVPPVAGG